MSNLTNDEPVNDAQAWDGGRATPSRHFYRAVWRWHFYAGLFVVPFLLMLSVTGIIYLFKPQLDAVMYRELLYVAPRPQRVTPAEQVAAVRQTYPGAQVVTFRPAAGEGHSSQLDIRTSEGQNLTVFVNPHNALVLGATDRDWNLQAVAVKLHGELMIGRPGDWLVELAACWGLVLIISGLYLWFPRQDSRVWGTLLPRLNLRDRRIFWRDLHAVPGFYGALVVAFLIVTGLPWADFWGNNFARVWSHVPPQKMADVPKSKVLTGSLNSTTEKTVPWAVEQLPLPQSAGHAGHGQHASPAPPTLNAPAAAIAPVSLDDIVALAQKMGVREGFAVALPQSAEGVYTISAPPGDPPRQATLHVDQYSGEVLADVRWRDYGAVPKAVEMGIAIHEGKYFGLANQLLMLAAALVVILLSLSGTVMWWRRRPAKRLGAPPMPKNFPVWKGAVAIIVVMGLAFPLVGVSLAGVLLLDYMVLSRSPRLKQVLG